MQPTLTKSHFSRVGFPEFVRLLDIQGYLYSRWRCNCFVRCFRVVGYAYFVNSRRPAK